MEGGGIIMEMILVNSSNLYTVGYQDSTLRIKFRNGSVYDYFEVPVFVFEGLLAASSKGSYHHIHIKNSFKFKKIK